MRPGGVGIALALGREPPLREEGFITMDRNWLKRGRPALLRVAVVMAVVLVALPATAYAAKATTRIVAVSMKNVIRGIPLDAHGNYMGTFLQLLNWYSLLIGLLGLCAIVTHGAAWLAMKLDGPVQERAVKVRGISQIVCVVLFVLATVATLSQASRATDNVFGAWYGWLAVIVVLGAVVWGRWGMLKGDHRTAFLGTALTIIGVGGIFAVSNYPDMVPARGTPPSTSLTVANSASGSTTLTAMLIITLIGFPIVIFYMIFAYRTFRGKAQQAHTDY